MSEYAFDDNSVTRTERASANCRTYPTGNLLGGIHPENYIHCDATQLIPTLNKSSTSPLTVMYGILGVVNNCCSYSPQESPWLPSHCTTYSDSVRGLPRLRFFAVPDDFNVWDAPRTSYPRVDIPSVPSSGEPAGHRSNGINVNFNTKKVMMFKYSSNFNLAVNEVQIFNCSSKYMIKQF